MYVYSIVYLNTPQPTAKQGIMSQLHNFFFTFAIKSYYYSCKLAYPSCIGYTISAQLILIVAKPQDAHLKCQFSHAVAAATGQLRCFLVKSTQIALHSDLYLSSSLSLSISLFGGKLVGFAARLMNRSQRAEITFPHGDHFEKPRCRAMSLIGSEQSRAACAPHPYLYSYIWRGPALRLRLAQHGNYYPRNCGKSRQTMRNFAISGVKTP